MFIKSFKGWKHQRLTILWTVNIARVFHFPKEKLLRRSSNVKAIKKNQTCFLNRTNEAVSCSFLLFCSLKHFLTQFTNEILSKCGYKLFIIWKWSVFCCVLKMSSIKKLFDFLWKFLQFARCLLFCYLFFAALSYAGCENTKNCVKIMNFRMEIWMPFFFPLLWCSS